MYITVLITNYNKPIELVERAIKSAYDIEEAEILFIDDGSTGQMYQKDLKALLKKYPKVNVKLRNKHGGIAKTVFSGYKLAKGDLIARLDAGDYFDRKEFIKFISYTKVNPADMYVNNWKTKNSRKKATFNNKYRKSMKLFAGNVVFKKKTLEGLTLPEGMNSFLEDKYAIFYALKNSGDVRVTGKQFYNYPEKSEPSIRDVVLNYDEYINNFKKLMVITFPEGHRHSQIIGYQMNRLAFFVSMLIYRVEGKTLIHGHRKYKRILALNPIAAKRYYNRKPVVNWYRFIMMGGWNYLMSIVAKIIIRKKWVKEYREKR